MLLVYFCTFKCLFFALQSKAEVAETPGSCVSAAAAGPVPEPGPVPGIPAAGGSHGSHRLGEHPEDGSNFL